MLQPGQPAPDFALPTDSGSIYTLADLTAAGPAVLYFYPADFTPVCTAEACALRDLHHELDHGPLDSGLNIAGISPQSPESHARFRKRHALPFVLLSDPDKSAIRAYDAAWPLGLGTRRVTYLISHDRIIQDAVASELRASAHAAFVKAAARSQRPTT